MKIISHYTGQKHYTGTKIIVGEITFNKKTGRDKTISWSMFKL